VFLEDSIRIYKMYNPNPI